MYGCAGPTTKRPDPNEAAVELEAEKQREIVLRELLKSHERLQLVGWPILKSGLPMCVDRKYWSFGFSAINKHNFPDDMQDSAISTLGMSEVLKIVFVNKGSPAEQAELMKSDVLISINGKDIPVGKDASQKFRELLREESKEGDSISLKISRNETKQIINIEPVETCDYPLIIQDNPTVNALADGNSIVINQGMMDFASSDDELALVVGHELAHNAMRHIDSKRVNAMGGFLVDLLFAVLGVNTQGVFTKAAANAYSQEFEEEADYVGLYIVERAGKNISDAPYFWRKMGVKHPGSIEENHAASHPSTPERFVAIEESIKEIENKKIAGLDIMPNIDQEAITSREPPPSQASKLGLAP